ncbi:MAG: hypothetical protein VX527_10660 [Planctomycetota bacterium]|nr:hypothetical protein [Planctomycetota bacterium]
MNLTKRLFQTVCIACAVSFVGCHQPEPTSFAQVHKGMNQAEVVELLGQPSSEWTAPPPQAGEALPDWSERWHYGDTLSTTASTVIGPDIAPDEVWVITFDEQGKVINYRAPIPPDDDFPPDKPFK